ncbi:MAG: hypothetical protein HWE25_15280 [Alphaproteobacteria bacterium]|nr:hypothetical protein [Alphaproteobacteria bacterium]
MRIWGLLLAALCFAQSATATEKLELLNATLVARFHFAEKATDGQMVGAYQVSFRNTGNTPITSATILLNPGLKVDQIVGAGGARLQYTNHIAKVGGFGALELNVIDIPLATPLKKTGKRQEIVIHYRGFLEDLSVAGLSGVKETLHPDFTMIRAQSFVYPVFANPNKQAIHTAWAHKPFHQVAFLDIPGTNSVIGNLDVTARTTNGAFTRFEMKSDHATNLMGLAIAPYTIQHEGIICMGTLPGSEDYMTTIMTATKDGIAQLTAALGAPRSGAKLKLAAVPTAYVVTRDPTFLMMPPLDGMAISASHMRAQLFNLWQTNPAKRANHWGTGLDVVAEAVLSGPEQLNILRKAIFPDVLNASTANASFGKTAIVDMLADGFASDMDATGVLVFSVLYDLLGEEEFFALVRGLRADLSVGYADMQSVADYLDENIADKKARKFAENWFQKGRIGKDMKKANSFEELVALYR